MTENAKNDVELYAVGCRGLTSYVLTTQNNTPSLIVLDVVINEQSTNRILSIKSY